MLIFSIKRSSEVIFHTKDCHESVTSLFYKRKFEPPRLRLVLLLFLLNLSALMLLRGGIWIRWCQNKWFPTFPLFYLSLSLALSISSMTSVKVDRHWVGQHMMLKWNDFYDLKRSGCKVLNWYIARGFLKILAFYNKLILEIFL